MKSASPSVERARCDARRPSESLDSRPSPSGSMPKILESRKGIVYGYHHFEPRTHPKVGATPKSDPPTLMPCPICTETVLATRHKYWDDPETLHRHQRGTYKGEDHDNPQSWNNDYQRRVENDVA